MSLKALLCIPLGHKWKVDDRATGATVVMRCERCERTTSGIRGGPTLHEKTAMKGPFGNKLP